MSTKLCVVCGKGSATDFNEDLDKIERELSELGENVEEFEKSRGEIEGILNKKDSEIRELTRALNDLSDRELVLKAKMNEMKDVEAQLHKREVISNELEVMKKEIKDKEIQLSKNVENRKKIEEERIELIGIYDKAKIAMQREIDQSINEIKNKFSNFVSMATNNESTASLSPDFIPVLNGRHVFHPEYASQFERAMLDYAFRFSLLSVLADKTNTYPSIIIETPDEVTDDAYIPHLAKAIVNFSSNLSVIITTFSTSMMKQLLNDFKPGDRKKRLFSLISEGTSTQKRLYQSQLQSYLSDKA